ncbi:prokaryotic 3-carboxy-cis,cis-muconate cycloisomerase (CMLE)-like protein [Campylobacter volucris]|uniref:Prokaryotic 3-carboxy-cis,cis-muconate cycloisomerase (CMLE)-like protein n=1 Tax=Campylobacter volucris TaxID=1031542 RepID=A0AAE6CZ89_9BACT|nr:adenylosuccinate lyase [Campylobacter volucris]AJC93623.1 prokaryotic 3-carboxy-cis,cis-muconate cycloisomerase (CMLE)-like protein [Campylobacter volucris LMG 24379]KAB0577739.1 prokaryotic 3-carboxy-cis,cis-muconate cycloisomerase (CMLE)-like protein [Campylobacter volucris]MBF7045297.1 prokaryotic 3-carboxy-cis,cis-muconate cycloisomerase (CMLE)-like protein [Campylobacter volucris]MBF7068260.1 prokaryotic 3-carboxy-cis,cis-muconate cycloisomerase (CMLE)-like protein [Campylobacter volucr
MGVSVFDMRLLQDSWSTPAMREIFSEENRIQKWLDVEAALAKAQAKLGIIPSEAAEEIAKKAHYKFMDMDFIFAEFKKTKHPLVPTVRGLEKACENGFGEYVHFGVTTQDVIDTGIVLQFKEAMNLIKQDLKNIAKNLASIAKEHKNTAMMGRTLALQALPITFGHKVAIWLSELNRHYERINELEKRLYVGSIVGAVGTKASLSEKANEVEKLTLQILGLEVPDISWQPARDRFIELGYVLGNINATFNKIAHQLLILTHNEIDELAEPFGKGQVGSSTMPHKRNPAVSENAVTVSNALRANIAILSDIERHEHERDGQVWKMEWKLLPETFLMLSVVLANMKFVFDGLEVKKDKMLKNLDILDGFVLAERVMFALSDHYGKQHAHEIVYENAMRGIENHKTFKVALLEDERVSKVLSEKDIDALMDATTYVGYAPKLVDEFLEKIANAQILK